MADSCQCMARATTILWGDWPPTNKNKWKKKSQHQSPTWEMSIFICFKVVVCDAEGGKKRHIKIS